MLNFKKQIIIFFILSLQATIASGQTVPFMPAEHVAIGDEVTITTATGSTQTNVPFYFKNDLTLSYGDILSLGDFYGNPSQPISLGETIEERKSRFLAAFHSFSLNDHAAKEANEIIKLVHLEKKSLEEGMQHGAKPQDIYNQLGLEYDKQYNCATGGGCSISWWLQPGRYLSLAKMNFDHFGQHAWVAYQTGHQIALEYAVQASLTHDNAQLMHAYAINAFACHFLTDYFSSGHIRTPRMALSTMLSTSDIGSLLSKYMHDEENAAGLHTHNQRGDRWIAYGDTVYFNTSTNYQFHILKEAVQNSANDVFTAYRQGTTQIKDTVYPLIPQVDEIGSNSQIDISPLFYWDEPSKQLMRRSNISNPYDRHWTASWWGWSTLLELARNKKLSEVHQAMLAQSEWGEQALQSGLITNPVIANDIKNKYKHPHR
jgi:hypothetical protein